MSSGEIVTFEAQIEQARALTSYVERSVAVVAYVEPRRAETVYVARLVSLEVEL